ncbi:MAG TPA: KTSC domain-containing protein [Kiritimatiellia bacterium]|nr:KTSC domain-containing protein [Kiritimatiellia bacterium]
MKRVLAIAAVVLGVSAAAVFAEGKSSGAETSYNAETKVMTVKFGNGKVYQYADVPQEIADQVNAAESKGQAVNKLLKKGGYKAKKVTE